MKNVFGKVGSVSGVEINANLTPPIGIPWSKIRQSIRKQFIGVFCTRTCTTHVHYGVVAVYLIQAGLVHDAQMSLAALLRTKK